MKRIRLTEGDLHKIIKESVRRALNEGFYDSEDDNEIYDIGPTNKYRISWRFVRDKGASSDGFVVLSDDSQIVNSEEEAKELYNMLLDKYKNSYAVVLEVERWVNTLSDGRWEDVYNASNRYIE